MLRKILTICFLLLFQNFLLSQNFELSNQYKELLREAAKSDAVYNYMLVSIELNWKKENDLISETEFISLREEEMKKFRVGKYQEKNLFTRQNITNSLESDAAETTIAVDPNNPNILVAATINNTSNPPYNIPVFYSMDGGNTWSQSSFDAYAAATTVITNANIIYGSGDPSIAIDNNGRVHFVYLTHYEPMTGGVIINSYYVYSDDGGQTFIVPPVNDFVIESGAPFTGNVLDRIWLTVDNSGGIYDGNLYLSGFLFSMTLFVGQAVYVKPPLATGFSSPPFQAIANTAQMGNMRVDDYGTVHLTCSRNIGGENGEILYTHSTDGGQSWENPIALDTGKNYVLVGELPIIHDNENAAPSIGVAGNNVYLAWSILDNNQVLSYFSYSLDGGINWSPKQEFGSVFVPGPYFHLMPCLAAYDDKCSVSWFVVDSLTLEGEYYLGEFINNGQSIGTANVISVGTTDFATTGTNKFYGDYNMMIRDSCIVHSIWADGNSLAPTTYVVRANSCEATNFLNEYTPLNGGITIEAIYPNPIQDFISIEFTNASNTSIQISITDVQGKISKEINLENLEAGKHKQTIRCDELSSGTYLISLKCKNNLFVSRKFIKK